MCPRINAENSVSWLRTAMIYSGAQVHPVASLWVATQAHYLRVEPDCIVEASFTLDYAVDQTVGDSG